MKMTPAASAGCVVTTETRLNDRAIVADLCDLASPTRGGQDPVGSESKRHYHARVNQTAITLWPLGAL